MAKTKREKGLEFQRWIKAWLEGKGWIVRNFPPTAKTIYNKKKKKIVYISQKNDVWGADLIARKYKMLIWIQASLDGHIQKRIDEFRKYFKEFGDNEQLQIWIKIKSGLINIKRVDLEEEAGISPIVTDMGKIIQGKFYSNVGEIL